MSNKLEGLFTEASDMGRSDGLNGQDEREKATLEIYKAKLRALRPDNSAKIEKIKAAIGRLTEDLERNRKAVDTHRLKVTAQGEKLQAGRIGLERWLEEGKVAFSIALAFALFGIGLMMADIDPGTLGWTALTVIVVFLILNLRNFISRTGHGLRRGFGYAGLFWAKWRTHHLNRKIARCSERLTMLVAISNQIVEWVDEQANALVNVYIRHRDLGKSVRIQKLQEEKGVWS